VKGRKEHVKGQTIYGKRMEAESNQDKKVDSRDILIVERGSTKRHSCAKLGEQLHESELSSWL